MPPEVKINVALSEHNCQKIGSERVKPPLSQVINELISHIIWK